MHGHERHNMLAWVCVTHIVFLTFEMMMRGVKKTSAKIRVAPISQEVNVIKEAKIYL
jgi:hypothetical protein